MDKLIEEFPFLADGRRNWADQAPTGWFKLFVSHLPEIKAIIENEMTSDFEIICIKEKWGTLRIYTNETSESLEKVLRAIEHESEYTCIECGAPATCITEGWIVPLCNHCASKYSCATMPIRRKN